MIIDSFFITRAVNAFPQVARPVLTDRQTPHLIFPGQMSGTRPGLRARSAAHAALKAAEQHLVNITNARQYQTPDIAPDLLPELRSEVAARLTARTQGQFNTPLTGYLRIAETAHAEADAAADKYRPKLNPESATQLVRTDQSWNNHIKPMLAAGKEWAEIIPTLDADGILAAERFAPGYEASIRDRFHQNEVPSVIDGIEAMSKRRVVDIAPPEGREALREAQDTEASLAFVHSTAGIVNAADHRNATTLSIGLTRSAYQANATRPVDESPDAQAAYTAQLQGTPSSPAQAA